MLELSTRKVSEWHNIFPRHILLFIFNVYSVLIAFMLIDGQDKIHVVKEQKKKCSKVHRVDMHGKNSVIEADVQLTQEEKLKEQLVVRKTRAYSVNTNYSDNFMVTCSRHNRSYIHN